MNENRQCLRTRPNDHRDRITQHVETAELFLDSLPDQEVPAYKELQAMQGISPQLDRVIQNILAYIYTPPSSERKKRYEEHVSILRQRVSTEFKHELREQRRQKVVDVQDPEQKPEAMTAIDMDSYCSVIDFWAKAMYEEALQTNQELSEEITRIRESLLRRKYIEGKDIDSLPYMAKTSLFKSLKAGDYIVYEGERREVMLVDNQKNPDPDKSNKLTLLLSDTAQDEGLKIELIYR